ncbi:NADH-ubiquinone oxidoreductase-F iron-sulfur binding region domain-containing protein, partial [Salmonella enterica]|uniref:NADH-ubiquinone oxidoreductase-F iron-sulfur binding region domain-containing protein n=1 Tax=Salmonella enterica TaxID=28901 RepID=UPI00398C5E7E
MVWWGDNLGECVAVESGGCCTQCGDGLRWGVKILRALGRGEGQPGEAGRASGGWGIREAAIHRGGSRACRQQLMQWVASDAGFQRRHNTQELGHDRGITFT